MATNTSFVVLLRISIGATHLEKLIVLTSLEWHNISTKTHVLMLCLGKVRWEMKILVKKYGKGERCEL